MAVLPRTGLAVAVLARLGRVWTRWTRAATMPNVASWHDDGYERGRKARAAILAELRRGEDAGEDAPTLRALAAAVALPPGTVYSHLVELRDVGLLRWEPKRWRSLELTRAGRRATN